MCFYRVFYKQAPCFVEKCHGSRRPSALSPFLYLFEREKKEWISRGLLVVSFTLSALLYPIGSNFESTFHWFLIYPIFSSDHLAEPDYKTLQQMFKFIKKNNATRCNIDFREFFPIAFTADACNIFSPTSRVSSYEYFRFHAGLKTAISFSNVLFSWTMLLEAGQRWTNEFTRLPRSCAYEKPTRSPPRRGGI